MNYDNVKLWFAKDEIGNIITIDEIDDDNKSNTYTCPMCDSKLIPKATKSIKITSHFAHVDANKCNEGMIHWWFKNKFLEKGNDFVIISDKERKYICKEVLIEQSYTISDSKIYNPDVTVITECGNTIYFEMDYSNKKKVEDYIDIWLELRNIVVEVDIKKLMSKDKIPTFKALFYDGKCCNTKKTDIYYNTIGKYKEKMLIGVIDDGLKKRIRTLDWFWNDILRYKNGELSVEYIYDTIFYLEDNKEDMDIVYCVLTSKVCTEDLVTSLRSFGIRKYEEKLKNLKNEIDLEFGELFKFNYKLGEDKKEIKINGRFLDEDRLVVYEYKNKEFCHKKLGTLPFYSKYNLLKDEEHINKRIIREIERVKDVVLCLDYSDTVDKAKQVNEIRKKINNLYRKERKEEKMSLLEFDQTYKKNAFYELEPYSNSGYYSSLRISCNEHLLFVKIRKNGIFIHIVSESGKEYPIETIDINTSSLDEHIFNVINDRIKELFGIEIDRLSNICEILNVEMAINNKYKEYGIETFSSRESESTYYLCLNFNHKTLFKFYITNLGVRESYLLQENSNSMFSFDNLEKYIEDNIESKFSDDNCKDCGNEVAITLGEVKFFTTKSLELPRRCKKCRELKKSSRKKIGG